MKFLKTIRFDPSDVQVFEQAAAQDEWAIPGGFLYAGAGEGQLKGKQKQAFSNAFWSVESYGCSTFTSAAEISSESHFNVTNALASYAENVLGAPSRLEATRFAEDEINYVCEMCAEAPLNSIFAVSRYFDETGEIREEFRIVQAPGEALHARVWDVVEE